jgi:hypothetical protein
MYAPSKRNKVKSDFGPMSQMGQSKHKNNFDNGGGAGEHSPQRLIDGS